VLAIVGLGNPGREYSDTRHNAGFMLVDGIVQGHFLPRATYPSELPYKEKLFLGCSRSIPHSGSLSITIEGELSGKEFLLVKPLTFMNESGRAVKSLFRRGVVKELSELVIVVDDINIALGTVRFREEGSAGGHNGLKSIIEHLGTNGFQRVRIGVGPRPDGHDMVEYVLSSFDLEEKRVFDLSLEKAALIVESLISVGFPEAKDTITRKRT